MNNRQLRELVQVLEKQLESSNRMLADASELIAKHTHCDVELMRLVADIDLHLLESEEVVHWGKPHEAVKPAA